MDSTLVIKVKYGDTLRRFNARVDIDDTLDLDMAGLRAKIISLFDLQPDAELTVTYVDEDGDVVTLVDDNDLHDVMKQRLKFLRIDVQLNNDKGGNSSARSSGISTPLRSPRVLYPVPTINVAEVLKSVPQPLQPLREAISKLSLDVASKAASGPVLGEVVDLLYKIGQAYGNLGSLPNVGAGSNPQNVAGPSNLSKDGGMSEVMPVSESFAPASKDSRDVLTGNVTDSVGAPAARNPTPVDLNLPPGDSNPSTAVAVAPVPLDAPAGDKGNDTKEDSNGRKSSGCHVSGRTLVPTMFETDITGIPFNECPFTGTSVGNDSAMPYFGFDPNHPSKKSCSRTASMGGMFHKGVQCDGCGVYPITGPRYKSKVKEDYDLCSICFSELGNEKDYIKMDRPVSFSHPRVKCGARSFKGSEDQMKGPWFRPPGLAHHMKENLQMKGPWVRGSVLTREHNFNSENPHMNPSWVRASVLTREHNFSRGCGTKLSRPKLDSRFILDVNVIDGTMMAPATPFTKIWRMRNSGSLIWPRGSQLVWIGGDRYSDAVSVEIEIPENGLPVDRELDIAVDFTAPASPGRYISYWKMASPSGQKFGQRVWVLIQVDASSEDSLCDSLEGLNLNLPLGCEDPEITDVNVQSDGEPGSSNMASEPVKPVVDELPKKDNDLNFPINDTLLVGHGISSSATPEAVSYPIVDDSEALLAALAPAPFNVAVALSHDDSEALLAALTPAPFTVAVAPSHGPFPAPVAPDHGSTKVVDASTSAQVVTAKNAVEEALLKDLEEMGFKQVDLNKEVLRMNEYNLEQSVDHLCGVDEWDPILEELHEMGFHDNETNKRLLVKNNGSIKRVVMDLITGEKAFS